MPTLPPVHLLLGILDDKRIISRINRRLYVLVYSAVYVRVRIIERKQTAKVNG